MKKYIYSLFYFILYFLGSLLYQYRFEITKATYDHALIPQLIFSISAIILSIFLALFLYECFKEKKQSKIILLITLTLLGILSIAPYLFFIAYYSSVINSVAILLNQFEAFSSLACFSFGSCLIVYIINANSMKASLGHSYHKSYLIK